MDVLNTLGWIISWIQTLIAPFWWALSYIPGAQTIVLLGLGFLVYWIMPSPIRRGIIAVLGKLWSVISPPFKWVAIRILRLIVRLAGEEVLKGGTGPVRIQRVEVPVYMPWRKRVFVRLRWLGYGIALTAAYFKWDIVGPYAQPLITWAKQLF